MRSILDIMKMAIPECYVHIKELKNEQEPLIKWNLDFVETFTNVIIPYGFVISILFFIIWCIPFEGYRPGRHRNGRSY